MVAQDAEHCKYNVGYPGTAPPLLNGRHETIPTDDLVRANLWHINGACYDVSESGKALLGSVAASVCH